MIVWNSSSVTTLCICIIIIIIIISMWKIALLQRWQVFNQSSLLVFDFSTLTWPYPIGNLSPSPLQVATQNLLPFHLASYALIMEIKGCEDQRLGLKIEGLFMYDKQLATTTAGRLSSTLNCVWHRWTCSSRIWEMFIAVADVATSKPVHFWKVLPLTGWWDWELLPYLCPTSWPAQASCQIHLACA